MPPEGFFATRTLELSDLPGYEGMIRINRGEWLARDHAAIAAEPDAFEPDTGRRERIRELSRDQRQTEAGAAFHEQRPTRDQRPGGEARDAALRAIETRSDELSPEAGDRLVELVDRDRLGADARYLAAVADPAYERAFAKRLGGDTGPSSQLDADEAEAMERVGRAMSERAMVAGDGASGGFAVPLALDPTIILTSDGSLNPLRSLATVSTITVTEWRGVTSEGVTAAFAPESTEVGDDTPTLAQPAIKPERAHSFVPFSIEIGQDWGSIRAELGKLFADAKDNLEAEKFLAGTGVDEPEGLLAGLAAGSVVPTATPSVYAADDVYGLQEAVPPRFQPRASWLSSLTIANETHRFSSPGGTEPPLFNENRDRLLGKPWSEVSGMSTVSTTPGEQILAYGDLRATYRIVDRIGLTIELVSHLFGANRRPTGERGLYAIWRVGAGVVVDNAVRVLEVAA